MRKRWLILGLLVVAAAALVIWRLMRPLAVDSALVQRGSAIDAVYASGTVEAADRVDVKARIAGPVAQLLVREGDAVQAGQLLARIDAPTLAIDVTRGKGDLAAARERASAAPQVAALEAQITALQSQLGQARLTLERLRRLAAAGAATPAEVDSAGSQLEVLEAQIAAARAQQKDARILLRAEATRQQTGLESLRARASDTDVLAPMSGVVLSRNVEPGEVVGVNHDLLRLGDVRKLHIEALVDEADIGRVRVGTPCAVRLYAFDAQRFRGQVARVFPDADRERKAFRVDVELAEPPAGLRPGMTAEVNVVTRQRDGVLLVPADAVAPDPAAPRDPGRGVVWVVEGGRARRRAVTVGIRDLLRVEVAGVAEGAEVVLGAPAKLKDGGRVRPHRVSGSP